MKDDISLGEMVEDKGQAEELQERNPDATIISPKETSKEKSTPAKGKENEETDTSQEKTDVEEEPTTEEDVEVLKADLDKAKAKIDTLSKQNKDKDSFIGKQSTEIGKLRQLETRIHEATSTTQKEEAKDELILAAEEARQDYLNMGYTKEQAELQVKPWLKMISAADRKRARVQQEESFKSQLAEIPDLVKNSGKINQAIFNENQQEILIELEKLNPVYRSRNLKEAVLKSYKTVVRDKADAKRAKIRKAQEEEREEQITAQLAPSPQGKGAPAKSEKKYDADSILGADSGSVF